MGAIIKRELYSYFCSPVAYVVMAIFFFFSGLFFTIICLSNDSSNLTYVFTNMFLVTILLTPILCMKLWSDEKRLKTDQALLTSPVSILGIVLGKLFAACILYLVCMAVYLVFGFVLSFFVTPNWAVILCNFSGLFILGSAMIAIDLFLSSLTESQMIAAITGFAVGLSVYLLDNLAKAVPVQFISTALQKISFMTHYQNFTVGLLSFADVVFFLSVITLFVFLTVRVIEKKRWS
ncbi:MAG: ABC transporter [Clostridia bacterium]|nr:ABC transporter [Clostridia bacterium]MBQ5439603.1 ABC transporter [Clostridia bacterium]